MSRTLQANLPDEQNKGPNRTVAATVNNSRRSPTSPRRLKLREASSDKSAFSRVPGVPGPPGIPGALGAAGVPGAPGALLLWRWSWLRFASPGGFIPSPSSAATGSFISATTATRMVNRLSVLGRAALWFTYNFRR